ncbi:MAG: epoxyqueuosine reductase QueH [Selenomonadaceae bacterium]|nr:epoxyqueuosine reductase QueH [Selenomonadaceae bacterium]
MNNKILLHMCCAPCSCYPVKKLRAEGIEPIGYFFNPNIHPYQEWQRRLKTAKEFAEKISMEIVTIENYQLREFLNRTQNYIEGVDAEETIKFADGHHSRCRICYSWRLMETAKFAKGNNFEAFTSTLFYSKHQNHQLMKVTAEKIAEAIGIKFYYEDFRDGWQEGIDISLELGLYRQNYCGCIFSEEERFSKEIHKSRKKYFKSLK